MIGIVKIDIFHIDVAIFADQQSRFDSLTDLGCVDVDMHDASALASSHRDVMPDGTFRYSMVLTEEANDYTLVHECCHMADFIMDAVGIPLGLDGTEVRAYMVPYIMAMIHELTEENAT